MKNFVKSVLTISVSSALMLSAANAATYKIIDKGAAEKLKYTYSQQENNVGEMAISGTDVYNFPVQFQYLDEDDFDQIVSLAKVQNELVHELEDIEDEAALRAGNPTANDLAWAIRFLENQSTSLYYQKHGDIIALTNFGGESIEFTVFDQYFDGTETYTRSTVDYVNGVTDQGWIYGNGSAPFLPMDFTEDDGDEVTLWLNEFTTRGFLSPDRGETIIQIMPAESSYGGESAVLDINDNGVAVGYASTEINEDAVELIEDEDGGCKDPDILKNQPFEACVQRIRMLNKIYNTEAFKWVIDGEGVVTTEALGYLVTPHPDDTRQLVSVAQAINNHGVAVGYSTGWIDETETEPSTREGSSTYAVVFKDGEVKDFTDDHGKYFESRAYDINDAGIAVGHATTISNGSYRTKFYYVDTNEEEPQMVLPKGFFTGSASTARAINEHGFIVGDAQVETHNDSTSNPRRTHGFLYDITTDTFSDLNSFLSCNSDYTVIEARDINENNEISATAVIKEHRRDAKGELMYDSEGEALTEDVIRAVKLSPIAGEIEDCSKVEEKVERKGASFGGFSALALLLFGFARRVRR
ncbi:hypothetical protein tinsulaeT_37590 [Thalassotalea insulae]|uniref:DUF3466 family protein n=1 Tax=Thalassotalea insulae TaxID=2056778 RepID=A0ABQ6GYL5_9GAMM|nr:DUF3466 family protein [Thalassotalea insulae]GLX80419.1 hypothetical protein tinsulaeT_37590 [Thalassotalea insulae]